MSQPVNPQPEQSGTYFVEDRSNHSEMIRLQVQDQMITDGMGGILPEQPDPGHFHHVLDIGCGTGGWLIEAATTCPGMQVLIGIDISNIMLQYAREQAATRQLAGRVEFHTMNALQMLEFPLNFFDLVNLRYGVSWLRTWEWPQLLREVRRVCRPGGVIRLTESDYAVDQRYPALRRLTDIFVQVLYHTGHLFAPEKDGISSYLEQILLRAGFQNVQTRSHLLEFRAGTPAGQRFAEDVKLIFQTLVPFFRKWTRLPDNYDEIYQQMLQEVQQPDFVTTSLLLTAWGSRT
ncbi:MAG TPA: methyltransferase domain-containing protein [Ktedonobacteraceae bacterium]|jgi:ubiquinone/menaquinone biosynthesis C-methylase UbiE